MLTCSDKGIGVPIAAEAVQVALPAKGFIFLNQCWQHIGSG
jgi:hypothetical protein